MNESGATEGNPSVEATEQHALGTSTYQKAEVVHRFADTHPWFHPLLIVGAIVILSCIVFSIRHFTNKKQKTV